MPMLKSPVPLAFLGLYPGAAAEGEAAGETPEGGEGPSEEVSGRRC